MNAYVRIYPQKKEGDTENIWSHGKPYHDHQRTLTFDIETTDDTFQNIKFGYFEIHETHNTEPLHCGFIVEPDNNTLEENATLEREAKKRNITIYTREAFVHEVFYPELLYQETLCIGFNLPFDLSRLATYFDKGRKIKRAGRTINHSGKFILTLTPKKELPELRIRHLDSSKSFIQFTVSKDKPRFKGNFLDTKTLSVIISANKHINLEKACEKFNKRYQKIPDAKHGKITPEYIEYNMIDVKATHELYTHLLTKYREYNLDLDTTRVYSEASLGKQALRQLGIRPFSKQNPDFSPKILGYLMSAYFGGWTECHQRETPTPVAVLDFLSMYPSTFTLMEFWRFVIAKTITHKDTTKETQQFLNTITREELLKKTTWKELITIVRIKPNDDLLPLRTRYNEAEHIPTVGMNYLTSDHDFWYALPDVIGTKILTGKTPLIEEAITFEPREMQDTLCTTTIFGESFDPREQNVIKSLIEKRQHHKDLAENGSVEDDEKQKGLKTLASATSYGIFIEMNATNQEEEIIAHSNRSFEATMQDYEEQGEYYNPIISVIQIAGSRLLMCMAQAKLQESVEEHTYMDTDSLFVTPTVAPIISEYLQPLLPYNFDQPFFKIEKKKGNMFYGISSKRYVLYKKQGKKIIINPKIEDKEFKLHGLGHLTNPFGDAEHWHIRIWQDILEYHDHPEQKEFYITQYHRLYPIAKQSISTPPIYAMFKKANNDKPFTQQFKPFNFFLVGQSTDKENIKPIAPYHKNPQEAVHNPFINAKTGEKMEGEEHWDTLDNTFFDYINHAENKFENGTEKGLLHRRHVTIKGVQYLGKEVHDIENEFLLPDAPIELKPKGAPQKDILNMNVLERQKAGITRQQKYYWKKKSQNSNK